MKKVFTNIGELATATGKAAKGGSEQGDLLRLHSAWILTEDGIIVETGAGIHPDADEAAFKIGNRYISIQRTDEGYDYSIYNERFSLLDGGVMDDADLTMKDVLDMITYELKEPVYDRERTICDIIRNKKDIEIQTFQTAMKEYMSSKGKNLGSLISYAREFGIEKDVRTYTEVML